MAHSTRRRKPAKPYPNFPLFPHAAGYWAKKIRGKLHYFGRWDDPDAALAKYLDQRDDLHAGRTPRITPDGLTVRDLANRFLTMKSQQRDAGDIVARTFEEYYATCEVIVGAFGRDRLVDDLAADDFERLRAALAKRYGVHRLGNVIQRTRTVFKYALDSGLLARPVRIGPAFKKPPARILRAHRQKNGPRLYEASELRTIIDAADQPLRAMILLGINCGFGNSDCGTLPMAALDLAAGWVNYPRPKTAIERRCPLWPEAVKAVREAIAMRPKPKLPEHDRLVFITKYGHPWANETPHSPVSQEFRKLLDVLKLHRPGLGFYALRHTFETIAGGSRDQVAVDAIMGHVDASMAAVYREGIGDDRLRAVAEHVHEWLFGKGADDAN
jgi:integrase